MNNNINSDISVILLIILVLLIYDVSDDLNYMIEILTKDQIHEKR